MLTGENPDFSEDIQPNMKTPDSDEVTNEVESNADKNGWITLEDGSFFNVYINYHTEQPPTTTDQ
jgi:hypothetical protein